MKLGLGITALLLTLALPAQAQAQPVHQTDAELFDFLHGCWSRVSWPAEIEAQRADPDFFASSQMCLDSATGEMAFFNCVGLGMDCWETIARYDIRDAKFWRLHGVNTSGGQVDACDILLEDGRTLTLSSCKWIEVDPEAEVAPVEDIRYERIIDL